MYKQAAGQAGGSAAGGEHKDDDSGTDTDDDGALIQKVLEWGGEGAYECAREWCLYTTSCVFIICLYAPQGKLLGNSNYTPMTPSSIYHHPS